MSLFQDINKIIKFFFVLCNKSLLSFHQVLGKFPYLPLEVLKRNLLIPYRHLRLLCLVSIYFILSSMAS